jgi:hypothetical protein
MKVYVKLNGVVEGQLPDISYELFLKYIFGKEKEYSSESEKFTGDSIQEYYRYLRDNKMIELTDYNSSTTPDITLLVTDEDDTHERTLNFVYAFDSDSNL